MSLPDTNAFGASNLSGVLPTSAASLTSDAQLQRPAIDADREALLAKRLALENDTTAKERAAVAARARDERAHAITDALKRAADAAAALAALEREDNDATADAESKSAAGDDQGAYYEALAVANLHAQASAVQNIRSLLPIVLDPLSKTYNKWRGHHLLVLGRYALTDHVTSDVTHPDVPAWHRMDCVVLSWIYHTISPELLEIISMRGSTTACASWLGVEHQFLGNQEMRALRLDAEFRNLVQGTLSMRDNCQKMKSTTDALGDLGEPVHDCTLVLNVLRGLSERWQYLGALIVRQRPFPRFDDVVTDLCLEELRTPPQPAAPAAPLALVAAPPPVGAPRAPEPT